MIKKREAFRPFAPAVLEERLRDFFEVPDGVDSLPFMNVVVPVKLEMREVLGAVTHVDGSARVQSVARSHNPRFHALIDEFGRITGVPVLLNTSFNNNAEPIVDCVDDCVTCLLTTGIDHLIVGDWCVGRAPRADDALFGLVATLMPSRKLLRRIDETGAELFAIESTAGKVFTENAVSISKILFRALLESEGQPLVQWWARSSAAHAPGLRPFTAELHDLWSRRILRLAPQCSDRKEAQHDRDTRATISAS
jgi:carbamoyltransferase